MSSHNLSSHHLLTHNLSSHNLLWRGRRGRRGTYGTGLALVARLVLGVAPGTPRRLAWQAWHFETSTFVSRGRRGTWTHRLPLCVADVALGCTHMSRTHGSSHYLSTDNCSHTTCPHTTYSTLSHTTLSHTTLLHTQTYTHNIVTHSSFTQPVLHHLLSFLPFPSHFHICLVIIGRS